LLLASEDLVHAGALDEGVEEDDEGLLVLVGEAVDLAVEGVEPGVLDHDLGCGLCAPHELVERDVEDVGDLDESV
jgi:hypothetical protein